MRVAREVDVNVSIEVRDASREVIVCKAPATNNIRNVREMEGEAVREGRVGAYKSII